MRHVKSLVAVAFLVFALTGVAQEDIRTVSGKKVNLDPVHIWLRTKKGDRPMPHWKQLTITGVLGRVATWTKCSVTTEDGLSRVVLIANLPASASAHFSQITTLRSQIAASERGIEQQVRTAKLADANAPTYASGSVGYVEAAMNERRIANQMVSTANERQARLTEARAKLADLEAQNINVLAMALLSKFGGMDIWECGAK